MINIGVKLPKDRLRLFNNVLSVFVVLLALYIAIIPVLPSLQLWWKNRNGVHVPYSGALSDASDNANKDNKPIPKDNRLVIPTIALDEEIKEGNNLAVIDNGGVWRRPNLSDSPEYGNMVIAGHRFTYANPYGAFYHLDKVKIGDHMAVYWQQKEYVYQVVDIKTVEPSATDIEVATQNRRLTLYTCTPIWSAKQRLVVIAEPVELKL